jgi:hypothetical protein
MRTTSISKTVRLAILFVFFSLFAAYAPGAHADDYYNRGGSPARIAADNGYRDGLRHGRFDFTEHHRYNIHSQQYNDANQGYDRSMGPYKYFKEAYRDAYARGYAEGYNSFGGPAWRSDGGRYRSY